MTGDEYLEVVRRVDPTRGAYQPGAHGVGTTACNFFAHDVCHELGAELPQLVAREQILWLNEQALQRKAWSRCDAVEAQFAADQGALTLATWHNPKPFSHSHIAVVVPSHSDEIHIAQAGAHCFLNAPLYAGFGSYPVRFFSYVK